MLTWFTWLFYSFSITSSALWRFLDIMLLAWTQCNMAESCSDLFQLHVVLIWSRVIESFLVFWKASRSESFSELKAYFLHIPVCSRVLYDGTVNLKVLIQHLKWTDQWQFFRFPKKTRTRAQYKISMENHRTKFVTGFCADFTHENSSNMLHVKWSWVALTRKENRPYKLLH